MKTRRPSASQGCGASAPSAIQLRSPLSSETRYSDCAPATRSKSRPNTSQRPSAEGSHCTSNASGSLGSTGAGSSSSERAGVLSGSLALSSHARRATTPASSKTAAPAAISAARWRPEPTAQRSVCAVGRAASNSTRTSLNSASSNTSWCSTCAITCPSESMRKLCQAPASWVAPSSVSTSRR